MVGKRQRGEVESRARAFLDLEAEVSDEEFGSDEELLDEEEECDPFIIDDEADDDIRTVEYLGKYRDHEFATSDEAAQLAALVKWRAEHHEQSSRRIPGYLNGEGEVSEDGDEEGRLTYWVVPVRPGGEKNTAKNVSKSLPPGMCAFATPWSKGRVYVVSPEDIDAPVLIRHCTSSLSYVYAHRQISRIPDEDRRILDQNMNRSLSFDNLYPIGSWVQIRHGIFRGDVARVYLNSSDSDEIYLQVVPRYLDKHVRTFKEGRHRRLCDRPPRHLFYVEHTTHLQQSVDADELRSGPIPGTYCLWSKVFFRNGLQLLRVQGLHYIKHHQPTVHDIIHYTIARIDTLKETNDELLQVGDRVREVKGRLLSGTEGVVVSKSAENVRVKDLADEDGEEKVAILGMGDVQRVFREGDAIEVWVGELRGRRGLVIDVPNMRELTFIDVSTKQQMCVLQAFLKTTKFEEYIRYLPTLSSMHLTCQEELVTHPCLYKIVYIIPEKRFARIVGVNDAGTHYYVEVKREAHGQLFAGQHLVQTETWLTLENQSVPDCEEIQERFKIYVKRETSKLSLFDNIVDNVESAARYIDFLPTTSHVVFVTEKNYKKFGYFVGTNGFGAAVVKFDDRRDTIVIPATSAISMKTFCRLDGTRPGRLRVIRLLYGERFCQTQKKRKKARLSQSGTVTANPTVASQAAVISTRVPDDQIPCSFVFSAQIRSLIPSYSMSFKFRTGCVAPRNVDGKTAWTTPHSFARRSSQDIHLSYNTHDGGHPREEYVPLSSIEPSPPSPHPGERALVIKGEHFGKVVFPRSIARNANKQRVGTYCTLAEKDKKKTAILFPLDSLIRIKSISLAHPKDKTEL